MEVPLKKANLDEKILFIEITHFSKDKSGVGIMVDYSRGYTVVNGLQYFFQLSSLSMCETTYFNLPRSAQRRHFVRRNFS